MAFVNALAGVHRRHPEWAKKFEDAGVPIVGDDIKSQVGATITHRVLAKLFEDRGVTVDRTYQLNVGGNMDFMNMLERERLESKKISKTQSVTSQLVGDMPARNVHIGPSDYVAWLDDRKWAFMRLEGRNFGDVPLSLEYKLEVGLPEQRRHHHRRHPRGQDRQGPRHRWPDPVGIQLLRRSRRRCSTATTRPVRPWRASSPAPSSAELTLSQGPLPGAGLWRIEAPPPPKLGTGPAVCPLREAHMTIKRIYRAAFPSQRWRIGNLNSGSAQFGRRHPQKRRARPGPDRTWFARGMPDFAGEGPLSPAPSSADFRHQPGPAPPSIGLACWGLSGLRNWAPTALCSAHFVRGPYHHKPDTSGAIYTKMADSGISIQAVPSWEAPIHRGSRQARPGQEWVC